MKEKGSWKWTTTDGKSFSAEQVEHKFDSFMKKALYSGAVNEIDREMTEREGFPVQPDDFLENVATFTPVYDFEKCEVRLKTKCLYCEREDLADALEKLKPREKEFIELSFVSELEDEDIAKIFRVSKKTVYVIRHRLIERLKEMMGV